MSVLAALKVVLGLDVGPFQKGASQAQMEAQKMVRGIEATGKKMAVVGAAMSAGLTVPLVAFGKQALATASDAAELQSAFNVTFGQMSDAMSAWAEQAGNAMGRSTQEMEQGANTFGLFFNQAAKTRTEAAEMSKTFAVLAQDLSSFYNTDPSVALEKLRSGLSGESEPLRDFGVFLTEAAVKAKGLQMGLADANGELSEQAKVMARANLILEATKNAQGDVIRTSSGAANQIRAAKAAWEELQVTIGTKLLPILTPLVGKVADLLNSFSQLSPVTQNISIAAVGIAGAFGPLLVGLGGIANLIAPVVGKIGVAAAKLSEFGGSAGLAGDAAFAFGATLGEILIPVAAVAAAGVLIYKNWDKIAPVLQQVWEAISQALGPAVQELISAVSDAFSQLWAGPLGDMIKASLPYLKEFGKIVLSVLGVTLVATIQGAAEVIGGLIRVVAAGIRALTYIFSVEFEEKVRRSINGLVSGIRDALVGRLGAIWAWVIEKITAVKQAFFNLMDAVVGHSYIPDMVDGIADHMARLDAVMVNPAKTAAERTKQAFEQLAQDVRGLMAEIFPEARALADFKGKLGTLDKAIAAGGAAGYSVEQLKAAREELLGKAGPQMAAKALTPEDRMALLGGPIGISQADYAAMRDQLGKFQGALAANADQVEVTNVRVVKSFKDMANETLDAIKGLVNSIKGGGFLDILGSVVGLATQLGSAGLFGKKIAANINKPAVIPGYAGGTNWHPGGMALVGENGPEVVELPRGSKVHPSGTGPGSGTMAVHVIPSPYFDVRVQEHISTAAPSIAAAGAQAAQQRMAYAAGRRV